MKKIHVKFKKPGSIKDFIKEFYGSGKQYPRADTTYTNSKLSKVQCSPGRMRSFDDLYRLVKTYYPSTTPKILMHHILTVDMRNQANEKFYPCFGNCSTMRKIRLTFNVSPSYYEHIDRYNSKWSWNELIAMLGLNTQTDVVNYINKYRK